MADPKSSAEAAFHLLQLHHEGAFVLSRKAGQFAGQLVASPEPLSDAQAGWLSQLMNKAGLPPIKE